MSGFDPGEKGFPSLISQRKGTYFETRGSSSGKEQSEGLKARKGDQSERLIGEGW